MGNQQQANIPPTGLRLPAATAIAEFLRAQDAVPPRRWPARFFGRSPLSDESRAWYWRALGEFEACRGLHELGDAHLVLHAVPASQDGVAVDHLVIGPGGVFAVQAVDAAGQDVWVSSRTIIAGGHRLSALRQTELAMGVVERRLSDASGVEVRATGVLVVVAAESLTLKEQPRDVVVLDAGDLARWVQSQPRELSDDVVATISAAAAGADTWVGAPSDVCLPPAQSERFEVVSREVTAARIARQIWLLGLTIGVAGSLVWVTVASVITTG